MNGGRRLACGCSRKPYNGSSTLPTPLPCMVLLRLVGMPMMIRASTGLGILVY